MRTHINLALSDLMLWVQLACIYAVAVDAVRAWRQARQDGADLAVLRSFAGMMLGLAFFFTFHSVIYLDRRHDIWPGVDLAKTLGFEWPWVPRLVFSLTVASFWVTYRYRPRR